MEQSRVRCPKCKSDNLQIIELWSSQIVHVQTGGEIDLNKGEKEHLYPVGLLAQCGCNHSWTIRGAKQIHDVLGEKKKKEVLMYEPNSGKTFSITK